MPEPLRDRRRPSPPRGRRRRARRCDVDVAPVGIDRLGEIEAAAGAAARIDRDHGIALRRVQPASRHELMAELVHRPAMQAHDRRIALSRLVVERLDQQAFELRAVAAGEADRLGGRQLLVARGIRCGRPARADRRVRPPRSRTGAGRHRPARRRGRCAPRQGRNRSACPGSVPSPRRRRDRSATGR